ncbi:recombinase family protein [Acetobacter farinalis]|uniref:Recombinase family protein n=1 Tax=Acetobacter farinalis TaxID=1260984 RepID=A0ABT3Q7K3_9PROT|nr:recombinase family protein [Acetobacter farinalis]MCX2561259.1 recombinase family protein [Acetobacter farinalis]
MALATSSMSARSDRPELLRRIVDLQGGEVVIAEKMDRISRLPLADAAQLVKAICNQGARRATLGVVDLSEVTALAEGVARIVLESAQEMLLRLALQMAAADDEDRRERQRQGDRTGESGRPLWRVQTQSGVARSRCRAPGGSSIAETARLAGGSVSQVKRVWAMCKGKRK